MTTLTKRQFRFLLLAYCALVIAGIFRALPQRTPLTSADMAAAKSSFGMERLSDSQFAFFMIWLLGAVLLAWLVGLISVFRLWRAGVYIFLISVCARLIIEYLRHRTVAGGWWLYGAVELLFEFAIVALALFGPAKHLFQRQREVQI